MREYRYTVTEHDGERPWIVLDRRSETVSLEDAASFYGWAARQYPRDRFTVELDPRELQNPLSGDRPQVGRSPRARDPAA